MRMAVPDYLRFDHGNSFAKSYTDEWFQTFDLFGYFEKYHVRADGTLWLTPTKVVPSNRLQVNINAPELEKVELKAVQILLHSDVTLTSDSRMLLASFRHGQLVWLRSSEESECGDRQIAKLQTA